MKMMARRKLGMLRLMVFILLFALSCLVSVFVSVSVCSKSMVLLLLLHGQTTVVLYPHHR